MGRAAGNRRAPLRCIDDEGGRARTIRRRCPPSSRGVSVAPTAIAKESPRARSPRVGVPLRARGVLRSRTKQRMKQRAVVTYPRGTGRGGKGPSCRGFSAPHQPPACGASNGLGWGWGNAHTFMLCLACHFVTHGRSGWTPVLRHCNLSSCPAPRWSDGRCETSNSTPQALHALRMQTAARDLLAP